MDINKLPHYDTSDNATGCCPRFHPEAWKDVELHFKDKPFVRAETRSAMHLPLNMGKVFTRVQQHVEESGAFDEDNFIVLSEDVSAWKGVHYFASDKPVKDEEMTALSGDFATRVFEGGYRDATHWYEELKQISADHDKPEGRVFFWYTTCPKCAKAYGENYVVGLAEI